LGLWACPAPPANWTWLANPALFAVWGAQIAEEKLVAALMGFASFAIAISFLFQRTVVTNEAGIPFPITGYGMGYWIWLSSMVISWFNSMATIELSVKRSENKK
jgi:hypothetical protein